MSRRSFPLSLAGLLALGGLPHCNPSPPAPGPLPPAPRDASDASPVSTVPPLAQVDASVPGGRACAAACDVLLSHACPEAQPDSGLCLQVCLATIASPFNVNPDCLAAAKDVAAVRACGTRCIGGR